jgi:methylated-DNA-[protein]-cysteine S-methyltransferase
MTELAWATLASPVGPLSVGCSDAGVREARFGRAPRDPASAPGSGRPAASGGARAMCEEALGQLAEYFAGQRRRFDVPVDWSRTSRLQQRVLSTLLESVGYGETVSYGALARRVEYRSLGSSPPARVIGRIMGSNPVPVIVPCHRVVAADGLGGYSGGTGLEVKRWLLTLEGALPPTLGWDATSEPLSSVDLAPGARGQSRGG